MFCASCLSSDRGGPEGWYMCADSSNGGYGQATDLQTPAISSTGPQCALVFWYYMSGFTVGSLHVRPVKRLYSSGECTGCNAFIRKPTSVILTIYLQVLFKYGNVTHRVWSQSGNQGNKWRRGEVFVGLSNSFQVCRSLEMLSNV